MPTRLTRATILAACAIALTACSEQGTPIPSGNPGTGAPSPTSQTTAPSQDDTYGAPRVDNPLDPAKQLAAPCTSLTPAQLRRLDMLEEPRAGGDQSDAVDPSCSWRDTANRVDFTVAYIVPNENGLADLYRGNEDGLWEYWEPTTVNGYPGVWQAGVDLRDRGGCTISVGVTDQLHFSVFVAGAEPSKACDQVKEVASAVVDTMKSGG